jgi:hypothetical protein
MNNSWTKPFVSLFAQTSTATGLYIKNQYITHVCETKRLLKLIDEILQKIQSDVLCAEKLSLDGEIKLDQGDIRIEYLSHLTDIQNTLEKWNKLVMQYKKRHDSEYAWDDYMKRSIFIDPRSYNAHDRHLYDIISEAIIPQSTLMVNELLDSISEHIKETKIQKRIDPYPDGFETQKDNKKPILVESFHDIMEVERNLLLYAKITL